VERHYILEQVAFEISSDHHFQPLGVIVTSKFCVAIASDLTWLAGLVHLHWVLRNELFRYIYENLNSGLVGRPYFLTNQQSFWSYLKL